MSGLKPATTYYIRAYAKSGSEVFYGNELSFTTSALISFVQSSMSAYYRLEKLTNEATKMQTGLNLSPEPGQIGLLNVSGYIITVTK